jgi:hypothetical protein
MNAPDRKLVKTGTPGIYRRGGRYVRRAGTATPAAAPDAHLHGTEKAPTPTPCPASAQPARLRGWNSPDGPVVQLGAYRRDRPSLKSSAIACIFLMGKGPRRACYEPIDLADDAPGRSDPPRTPSLVLVISGQSGSNPALSIHRSGVAQGRRCARRSRTSSRRRSGRRPRAPRLERSRGRSGDRACRN